MPFRVRATVVPATAVFLLAGPAGMIWIAVAPRPEMVVLADGGAGFAAAKPHAPVAADGWFAVVTGVVGVLCGLLAHVAVARLGVGRYESLVLVGLAVGGLAAAVTASRLGPAAGAIEFARRLESLPQGAHLQGFVRLRATAMWVIWPVLAVVTFVTPKVVSLLAATVRRRA